jgi:putative ABC transport system ATP-binding protein
LIVQQQYHSNLFSFKEKQDREFFADYLLAYNPNLSSKLDQTIDKLSGGEKQALALALTVLHPPKFLLLDEHTSALDPKSAEQLMSLTDAIIKKHKITCILTTHDLAIAEQYGNRLIALRNGKIYRCIEVDEKKILSQQELFATCY